MRGKESMGEGCLSYPGKYVQKRRWRKIVVKYFNGKETVEEALEGMESRIFQHEYDHLLGKTI